MNRPRAAGRRMAVVAALLVLAGCSFNRPPNRSVPLPPGVMPEQLIDADNPAESVTPLDPDDLAEVGRIVQAERKKRMDERALDPAAKPPKSYNILSLSGGAVYGAYSVGVLSGWSQSGLPIEKGGRPQFDVVTGISTGALIAPFAFLGPQYDDLLRREYTTIRTEDVYVRRRSIRGIFAESVVDNTPLKERVKQTVTDAVLREVAAEHANGRRLYVGTTNIDTKRIAIWDIGAIASRGTPDAFNLARTVLLASASIPALFPPVRVNVTIDGRPYEELHVDGAISRSLFFRPPVFTQPITPDTLADSNLYVIVAGKLNPAPAAVRVRTLSLALASTDLLLYNHTRGDLYRMYNYCLLTGMNLRIAAIPDDAVVTDKGTEFDPVEMTKLFDLGFQYGRLGDVTLSENRPGTDGVVRIPDRREGTAWRDVPPGLKGGEKQGARTGRNLTVLPDPDHGAHRGPEPPKQPIPPVPPVPGR